MLTGNPRLPRLALKESCKNHPGTVEWIQGRGILGGGGRGMKEMKVREMVDGLHIPM
jgi:hypothetical protein